MTPTAEPVEIAQSPDCVMEIFDALAHVLKAMDANALDGGEAMCILIKTSTRHLAEKIGVEINCDELMARSAALGDLTVQMAGGGLAAVYLLATTLHGLLGTARRSALRGLN